MASVELNHTIVAARDKRAAAGFLAELLGLPAPSPYGPFTVLELSNGVSLDFLDTADAVVSQHYAFLVSEADFDAIFERLRAAEVTYYADPQQRQVGEINRRDGGRGLYFENGDGHILEILTRPYGSGN